MVDMTEGVISASGRKLNNGWESIQTHHGPDQLRRASFSDDGLTEQDVAKTVVGRERRKMSHPAGFW